ncbi:MAG: 30S ribosomal protein S16 [Anaerolineales bacterium]|nr:30S ribosomal protein S16 [Anaerolineales bacterium]MCB9127744.1 30S ribosomal protein S16 [Ardenticatenales bacterium]
MVKIRLRRHGKKGQPTYRIVVAEVTSPRDGRFIETLGHYNPRTEPETVVFDQARALYWLSVGAQPTDSVRRFFEREQLFDMLPRVHAGESPEAVVGTAATVAETPVAEAEVERAEEVAVTADA